MKPASLTRRLSLGAAAFIALAMVLSTIAIGFVLHRFIQGQIDQRLDSHVVFLNSLLREAPDGTISLAGDANGPPFDRPDTGWYWQVVGPKNSLTSHALADKKLGVDATSLPPRPSNGPASNLDRPRPADGPGPDGHHLHYRILTVTNEAGAVAITVTAPRAAVLHPLQEALTTLAVSLGLLALALIAATYLQVRLGLRPLAKLRRALGAVRIGEIRRLPEDQPAEVLPLVHDLNALFDQNEANLERARRHVANLAHGLKTPLATLAIIVADRDRAASPETRALVASMEQRIRHHLGRARIAALGGPVRARTNLSQAIKDILAVLTKANADRPLQIAMDVPDDINAACEQQDLDEIVGNILENAFKWASQRVAIVARQSPNRFVQLVIADDGPGVRAEQIETLVLPGRRLDETVPGFGFGLPIARELSELYGGSISLSQAALGGLKVTIQLPTSTGLSARPSDAQDALPLSKELICDV